MQSAARTAKSLLIVSLLLLGLTGESLAKKKKQKNPDKDPYAEYVWPTPPDEPRIKLEAVIRERSDVEAKGGFQRMLMTSAMEVVDKLRKPHAVAFTGDGRILVTDPGIPALLRFDREGRRFDVFGTKGRVKLKVPLGLAVGPDDVIYVADAGLKQVVAYDQEGELKAAYGGRGELVNPTDAALSVDGKRLFVADSKGQKVAVYDVGTGDLASSFGEPGTGAGQFNHPTSLAIDREGNLYVVDQINSRIQVFEGDGAYLDEFGSLGTATGNFVRPKDVAVDEVGFIYVTDTAFNNVQLFDFDFTLLTFVGEGGTEPGQFFGASGVAVRGNEFAVVDQLGARLQVFRFIVPKDK